MLIWRGVPEHALSLLAGTLPANSPKEMAARKGILQGRAYCRVDKQAESDAALSLAEGLIGPSDDGLRAELAFARAKCSVDPVAARSHYWQTVKLAHGNDPYNEANALLYVGYFSLQDKRYGDAISRFKEALALADSFLVLKEKALGNLGYTYSQLGDVRRAIDRSSRAESVTAQLVGLNPQESWIQADQEKWLIDLGREHFHQIEYPEAEAAYVKALAFAQNFRDGDHAAICLHNLAQLALRTKDWSRAEDYIRQLEAEKPTGERYLDLLLDQAELASAHGDLPQSERLLKQLLEQQRRIEPAVLWKVQSDLAALYAAQGKFDPAENMFRKAVATAEAARPTAEGVEYRLSFLDYAPFYDQYVKFLVSQNRQLEALAVAEQGRSPTLSEGLSANGRSPRIDIGRIQAVLKQQHQIVLAYWLGWEESYLWVITPTQVRLKTLPAELEIEKEIEAYNREIIKGGTLESLQNRGQGLYKTLIGPAEPYLSKGSTVIIVPHRKLYNLAFYTLVVPVPSPHYWIEDVKSYNVSFLSALTNSRQRSAASKELLMLGAPLLADKQFPVLQHAPAEMEKIAAHFPAVQEVVISGKDATPAAYLASHPGQFRSIHLVTHGTSSTVLENPLDSAIILSPFPGSAAAAADSEGSYRLYGKDIMKTPLQADLVIISACYGMGREYSGEGLVGLAWAFLRAGSHQVIAALWEVDDASMPQLMDDFYQEYTHGKSAAEALRDAKMRMLHSNDFHKRPYYWASLQLYTGS